MTTPFSNKVGVFIVLSVGVGVVVGVVVVVGVCVVPGGVI
jgi:hypothetical protein